jgi:hypothetical protein
MVSHALFPGRRPASRRWRALVVHALGIAMLGGLGSTLLPAPAEATRLCGDRTAILKQLERRHEETPQALGLSADGGVLELLVAPSGGWTILVTYPKRPTCVLAVGQAWQTITLAGEAA